MNRVWVPLVMVVCIAAMGCSTMTSFTRGPGLREVSDDALRQVACQIETAVAAGNRDVTLEDMGGMTVNTEEIHQAVRTRAARYDLLSGFLDTGHAWERLDGQVWVIRSSSYKKFGTRKDRDRYALMVNGEAADRWVIYEQLQKANNLSRASLNTIQRIFFEERVKLMKPGQKYEAQPGEVGSVGGDTVEPAPADAGEG